MKQIENKASIAYPLPSITIPLLGSIFLALMSQLAIYLPISPVPVTMQTLGVFLLGGLLGSKRGTLSVISYLAQGTAGLPVFAGGMANPLWFCDPKAGFLLSFIAASFLIGKMTELKPHAGLLYILLALTIGQMAIFIIGTSWLALFVGPTKAYLFGVIPFLCGAGCKILAGSFFLKGFSLYKQP